VKPKRLLEGDRQLEGGAGSVGGWRGGGCLLVGGMGGGAVGGGEAGSHQSLSIGELHLTTPFYRKMLSESVRLAPFYRYRTAF